MYHLIIYFLFTSSYHSIECNYFMAATGMRELSELEAELAKSFLSYYQTETERLNELEVILNEYDKQNNSSNGEYIYNPLDAYKFLKRFTRGWEKIDRFQRPEFKPEVMNKYFKIITSTSSFDNLSELWGSIYAIIKLQETYRMEVSEFTDGYKHSQALRLYDIFTIGYYAMSNGYFAISALWLEEAYTQYYAGEDKDLGIYNITRVVESLIWDYHQTKNYDKAAYYSGKLVELEPDSLNAKQNYEWYKYQAYWKTEGPPKNSEEERFGYLDSRPWLLRNNRLCRREENMRQVDIDRLSCSYYSPSSEFLLKPLQLEVAYLEPQIHFFHNLLSDYEVDYIVKNGVTVVQNAYVYSMESGKIITADYRIGKSGWLPEDYVVHKIVTRVGRLTGLNMEYSEPLQVMNYGIGGNYESHYDHATPPYNSSMFGNYDWGNRIATMLIYLSEVEKGGETVFTTTGPGVIISPKRGSAVFWYNLNRNGTGDDRTKHAGCPIMLGEKWIANLWIHEWGQEFRRPCTLNRNE